MSPRRREGDGGAGDAQQLLGTGLRGRGRVVAEHARPRRCRRGDVRDGASREAIRRPHLPVGSIRTLPLSRPRTSTARSKVPCTPTRSTVTPLGSRPGGVGAVPWPAAPGCRRRRGRRGRRRGRSSARACRRRTRRRRARCCGPCRLSGPSSTAPPAASRPRRRGVEGEGLGRARRRSGRAVGGVTVARGHAGRTLSVEGRP